jgi:lysophospholipase L1-like esterase
MNRLLKIFFTLLITLLLIACGGGTSQVPAEQTPTEPPNITDPQVPNPTDTNTSPDTQDNNLSDIVTFTESKKALKNPLKGFILWPNDTSSPHEYVSMFKAIIPWNELENNENDTVDKIRSYSNNNIFNNIWYKNIKYSVHERNIKVNPLVLLQKSKDDDFSPADMDISEHDNQTEEFIRRIKKFVPKLAKAWDNDPRIGFINIGILGTWGEQSSIMMTPEVAEALGDSFSTYFKHKKVLVRVPNYFDKTYLKSHNGSFWGIEYSHYYRFGMYWDAFANDMEDQRDIFDTSNLIKNAKLWVDQPILGEVAFNMKYENIYDYSDYPDEMPEWPDKSKNSIHDTLTHQDPLDYIKDYIRSVHCSGLSWISGYNENNKEEAKAAQELQKIMGYRFVLKQASYNHTIKSGGKLNISFSVENSGSAPFYYPWPVEISLLDIDSKEVVWREHFNTVDIRKWLPGEVWDFDANRYTKSAKTYTIKEDFVLPENLQSGEYILALSINDPAGNHPSVRFSVINQYNNGRTAIGIVGINVKPSESLPRFDDTDTVKVAYDKVLNENTDNDTKIFIIGDSTVHNEDYPDDHGGYFERGWGDVIAKQMKRPEYIFNEARSGASSSSYRNVINGRHDWPETRDLISNTDITNGAYLLIQFGHNDAAEGESWYTEPGVGKQYYSELKSYIFEARELGVTPVLITPVERTILNTHSHTPYADTMRQLAKDENVLLLDLTKKSYTEFNKYITAEELHDTFNYRKDDHTHFNPTGASIVASWVRELACSSKDKKLCMEFK